MFLHSDKAFDLEEARPSTEPLIEVTENADNIWTLQDVVDMAEEEARISEEYKWMSASRWAIMTKK